MPTSIPYAAPYDGLRETDSDKEAIRRADFFHRLDPFPNVTPALLDDTDFRAYMRVTCMLFPYSKEAGHYKPASYEARAKQLIFWDDNKQRKVVTVVPGEKYKLLANSITFALIDSTIRLPDYIALRFNLRIKHVHRGLLLGTGPLVDPGFRGDLLIPLHNLTSDDYEIDGGEGLIWIEFTKTSRTVRKAAAQTELEPHKKEQPPEVYFERANRNNPIRSSLPQVVKDARKAESAARKAKTTVQWFAGVGFAAIAATVLAVVLSLHSYFGQMNSNVMASNALAASVVKDTTSAVADLKQALDRLDILQKTLEATSRRVDELETAIRQQATQIDQLRERR